jgi:hypothetical protein
MKMAKERYISDLTTEELFAMAVRLSWGESASWGEDILDQLEKAPTDKTLLAKIKADPVKMGYVGSIIELGRRRGYKTYKEVIAAMNEWRSEQYEKKWEDSYCAKCPASPGKEQFVQDRFHLPLHCMGTIDDLDLLMNCDLPKKKEDCFYASTLDDKCDDSE